ncbi:HNH endonuclease [Thioalkalivibrio sp. ALJ1]|uniref:HNH endonuclease n=1 Tax=Thioalkalivibrio sp. ALJ1 TaxID=1158144 RepID=UPI0009DF0157|nr:HNH endonuclease [Thioalkalivibrio sp. ALJ1]
MAITDKSIKLLWSNAAGRCSFDGCSKRLTVEQASEFAPHTLGEMAHIKGRNPGSNRYDEKQPTKERDSYENLILLCPTHHTLVDKPENESYYTVETLHKMKTNHEASILNRLNTQGIDDLEQLMDKLSVLLSENHQAWEQYGPLSNNAKQYPNSDQVYALWTSARLSIIVPNNRNAKELLVENRNLLPRRNQKIVSKFLTHAESYEKWVRDEIPYQAVLRFPKEFEMLVFGE